MNEIYWQQTRPMTSTHSSSSATPLVIQSKRLYESKYRAKYFQPIKNRLNTYLTTDRIIHSPYLPYASAIKRSYNNIHLPYAMSSYGIYRQSPVHQKLTPFQYTKLNRCIELRTRPRHVQRDYLSRSVGDDYYYPTYDEYNGYGKTIYNDEKENDKITDYTDIFNYALDSTGVSQKDIYIG
ncbi:unnamed protein product [Adineta ricciae]|uniref:Uncharacterized protein n=1 Tax=Adineta ricciae TaxID=249248 RepID=A0A814G240_ADIRI|nr:unnamed protein product [Adineta ricciae]